MIGPFTLDVHVTQENKDLVLDLCPVCKRISNGGDFRSPDGMVVSVDDVQGLTVRKAGELTGFAAADFSRIRQAKLDRFTIDRLLMMLTRLGQKIDITLDVRPREMAT